MCNIKGTAWRQAINDIIVIPAQGGSTSAVTKCHYIPQHSALYLACAEGRPKCVEFLLKCGMMITYNYYHHGEEKSMSCLNAAIDADHL